MSINAAIFSHLSSDSAVAALVGTRVYPLQSPELGPNDPMPNTLVYARVSLRAEQALNRGPEYFVATYGFNCAAGSYDDAHAIADAVITSLYLLVYPTKQTVSGERFEAVKLTDSRDDADNTAVERGIFTVYVEFEISFK